METDEEPRKKTSACELECGQPNGQGKRRAFFHVTRACTERKTTEHPVVQNEPLDRRSFSTPQNLTRLGEPSATQPPDSPHGTKKAKKKHFSLRKIFKKDRTPSDAEKDEMRRQERDALEEMQRRTELEFAHRLMTKPEEMASDLCRVESEPDLVQTICSPNVFNKDAIKLDKKLYQIDVANARISTLSRLSGTAVLVKDYQALEFLEKITHRIRKQNVTLFKEADKYLTQFKRDPNLLLNDPKEKSKVVGAEGPHSPLSDKIMFIVSDDDDQDGENLRWELNSLSFSTDNSSTESDEEGPTPEEVENLAHEIRKAEGTRFKKKSKHSFHSKQSQEDNKTAHMPPPPNPLGHSKRALLRSHSTVPNGLCEQGSMIASSSSSSILGDLDADDRESIDSRRRVHKSSHASNLPFNLLSLTGQLSWLVSEYIERDTSTYKWATELIHKISTMSVNRATWLNVHQQLRETTELLYKHRDKHNASIKSKTAKGEIAWNRLQLTYETVASNDGDNATVTAETARKLFANGTATCCPNSSHQHLVHLARFLEKKFHLAYVCDLILWKAQKLLYATRSVASADTAKYQLIDFRIRHMQLRLDQANFQNWSSELTDWMTCWIDEAINLQSHVKNQYEDNFCLDELRTMQSSVKRFHTLVQHLRDSEFMSDVFLDVNSPGPDSVRMKTDPPEGHQHHPHYHPHLHHHGEGGHQQDLRPMEADRCSHTYAALVRQIHEHAMSNRPLSYFAERALYDMAVELDCPIDWKERLTTLLDELTEAYKGWELLLQSKLNSDYYNYFFESHRTEK
ncbi:hypothetical protein CSKR_111798 [Clonorchis sinensis]|uniref:Uncharacterized protein n=2 Tax=Clonorchis sinensis TaxID=79923 RepID=A0A8T1MVC3_CLOSI|nr:hypothetical protein CSKR_111798 [Clonorchis sinensis]GAA52488.1 hypothetical protein CLF_108169 [Clonorchis sinensis]